jgi:hypothetical protein
MGTLTEKTQYVVEQGKTVSKYWAVFFLTAGERTAIIAPAAEAPDDEKSGMARDSYKEIMGGTP